MILVVALAFLLLLGVSRLFPSRGKSRADVARENVLAAIRSCFMQHPTYADTLRRIWSRTVYTDEFGDAVYERWFKELDKFIKQKRPASFNERDLRQVAVMRQLTMVVLEELWNQVPAAT